jgi:hypothetical protein
LYIYNPEQDQDPDEWLSLEPDEAFLVIEAYHRKNPSSDDLYPAPLHSIMHAMVETQLAMDIPPVREAFERLKHTGLDRHAAVHTIGAKLMSHIKQLAEGETFIDEALLQELTKISSSTEKHQLS